MDIKTLLKDARAAIKNKDFQTAMKLSKSIIKQDKNNYMALVLLGMSLQEIGPIEHTPKAFQKAIDLNQENPLAWQGLISYYEKVDNDELKGELVKAYLAYLKLEVQEHKLVDYSKKLVKLNGYGDLREIYDTLMAVEKKCVENSSKSEILSLLRETLELFPEDRTSLDLYESFYELFPENFPEKAYSTYLNLLNKSGQISEVLKHALKMHELYPSNPLALGWICKAYNQKEIDENLNISIDNISEYVDKCLKIDPKNAMALVSKAILLCEQGQISSAKDILKEVTTQRPALVYAWIILTDILTELNSFKEALISLNKSQKLVKALSNPEPFIAKVNIQEIGVLVLSECHEDWKRALELYVDLGAGKSKCLTTILNLHLKQGNYFEVESNISKLNDPNLALVYKLRLYKCQKKYLEAEKIIAEANLSGFMDWWIEVGLVYWEMGQYKKSLEPYLKAAKCEPNNYKPFVHLGHYYSRDGQLDKARRCYEKAFKINSSCSVAGSELSKIYRKQKNWESNLSLLTSLTQGYADKSTIWAWLQLGLTYLEQGDPVKALEYLRMVLRIEPENVHCWESLADAYFAKGAFTSALKCYQKSTDLSQYSLYAALQVAYIKKILGEYPDAQKDFENILTEHPNYVPALKGLSETSLCQAKDCLRDQRLGTARDYAQSAVNKVTQAVLQRSELSCLWKLLADSILLVAKLPEKYSFLRISRSLLTPDLSTGDVILEQEELFEFVVKCYCKSVSLNKENSYLWHDLATCYLQFGVHIKKNDKSRLLECALSAAHHCTTLNPENWLHWNLLGNVAMLKDPPNYALAQHSFIKAVIAESNSAIAWTNLGVLYLLKDDLILANKAFGEGQRADPNYVNSWIGQALIAELMDHSDAMDLFRHSTQLGQHQQGSIGYAHWVCHTLINCPLNNENVKYNIYNMHAVPVAYDAITWYTEKNPDNSCAWNMLGILSERMGLLKTSKNAFKQAFALSAKSHKDIARVNYGRLLYRTENYREAIEMFGGVQEATFSSGAGLALALFRNGDYENSYAAYEQALHWLTDEQTSQSDLLVALASMAYKFQGPDAAKTLLFQSINLKPPSPWSLYATFSLSLLHNDMKLAQLVLKELVSYENHVKLSEEDFTEYIYHYSTLLAYVYLLQDNKRDAVCDLSKLLHKHPNIGSVWIVLSRLMLRMEKDKNRLQAGAKCARSGLKLGQKNMNVSKIFET
ncbi:tetratricopeptide repeat protein 37 isoform X2 [Anthonomus grandis grandis]|uniref:tetratricopeptide repeat protein 37 isoform X2 n=1 Tax=Anthonomus grandis grandis TaxID=2921223 RepID=UPI0021660A50|nr:tetratricopeptide repeat protein 37 isoform X2 [Anthonomus grandis grandis]